MSFKIGLIFSIGVSIILSFNNSVNAIDSALLEVETPNGKLLGQEFFSRNGRSYLGFRGIPYGIAERFQAAEPFPSWTGIRNAKEFGNVCPHFDMVDTKSVVGDENCLNLNVYTNSKDKLLPVLVFFHGLVAHGGSFELGSSNDYDAMYFMDEPVLLVTVNYRLGALGFLNTENSEVSGNNGLKDLVLALQWVQTNIQAFGGDKQRVTIFGESAGSALVHYLLLSPMSKNLFQNAISQSGSSFCPWGLQKNPKWAAETLGTYLDCSSDSSESLVDCLKSKTPQEIVTAQLRFNRWALFPFGGFAPSVETQDSKEPKFLTETPEKIMATGNVNRVPWIVGFNEDEGIHLSTPIMTNENFTNDMNEKWNHVAPIALFYDQLQEKQRNETSDEILEFYFGQEDISEETWQSLTDMFSDRIFVHGIDKAAKQFAKYAPVYPYVFTFAGGDPIVLRAFFGITGEHGVGHADELQYQFNGIFGAPEYIKETQHEPLEMSQRFIKLWVSFAENSVPKATWRDETEWKPISDTTKVKYYEIAEKTRIWDTEIDERMALWNKLSKIIDAPQTKSSDSNKKDEL